MYSRMPALLALFALGILAYSFIANVAIGSDKE
jgi:hypothetical protein